MFSNKSELFNGNTSYYKIMKQHLCSACGETDPSKFAGRMKGTCYSCHKARYRGWYADKARLKLPCICLSCGTTNPNDFYPNGGTKCKKCLYIPKPTPQKPAKEKKPPKYEKLAPYTCRRCKIEGKENFYENAPFICKKCYNRKSALYYYPYYDRLVEIQGGEFCYICRKTPQELGSWRMSIDHDHETGLVRGLLCSACNFRMEHFNLTMARNLANYLQNPPAAPLAIVYVSPKTR